MPKLSRAMIAAVISVALVVVMIGTGMYWWSKHSREYRERGRQVMAGGRDFGRATDDEGCLNQALAQYEQHQGFNGALNARLFLHGCLGTGRETPGFCDRVPTEAEVMKSVQWRTEQCTKAGLGLDVKYCGPLLGAVQEYCDERRKR